MIKHIAGLAAFSALLLASAARAQDTTTKPAKPAKVCFDPDDVQNFKYQKRNTMLVTTHRKEAFVLTLAGVCPDLESANGIGFSDVFAGDICSTTRASLIYNGISFGSQKCRIANIERATTN